MPSQFSYLNEQSPGEAQQDTVQADFEQEMHKRFNMLSRLECM